MMDDDDKMDELIDTVQILIKGCEDFVVNRLDESEKKLVDESQGQNENIRRELKRRYEEIEQKLKNVRDCYASEMKEMKDNMERLKESIEKVHENVDKSKCKCEELWNAVIGAGEGVFQRFGGEGRQEAEEMNEGDEELLGQGIGENLKSDSSTSFVAQIFRRSDEKKNPEITELHHFPEELQNNLKPYLYPKNPMSSREKLSDIQRAFFNYQAELAPLQHLPIQDRANTIFNRGIDARVWSRDFRPGEKDFTSYLKQRLKNFSTAKKLSSLKRLSVDQKARLADKRKKSD